MENIKPGLKLYDHENEVEYLVLSIDHNKVALQAYGEITIEIPTVDLEIDMFEEVITVVE